MSKLIFRTYLINSMSIKFKEVLRRLTFGDSGLMSELLDYFDKETKYKGYALCIYDDSKVIGWILYSNVYLTFDGLSLANNCVLHIYVDEKYRNKGIGKNLMFQANKKIKDKVVVFPHDEKSNKLFDYCSRFMDLIKD